MNSTTREVNERLPITFVVFAYNQESFIQAAIEGALSQTYSPLTIILSDDHSTDQTFSIMEEMARQYKGPHKVLLNRNENNLGLCGHINKVMDLVATEWVVIAAGDDVSLPCRVESTWEAIKENADAYSIFFDLDYIRDDKNNFTEFVPSPYTHTTENFIKHGWVKVAGPSHAWNMSVFRTFGPIPSNVISEDSVIPFRSTLLGKVVYVPKKVVKYRLHFSSISTLGRSNKDPEKYKLDRLRLIGFYSPVFDSYRRDLGKANQIGLISENLFNRNIRNLARQQRKLAIYMAAWKAPYFKRIWGALFTLIRPTSFTGEGHKQRVFLLIDAIFPFLDGIYHKHVRCKRI